MQKKNKLMAMLLTLVMTLSFISALFPPVLAENANGLAVLLESIPYLTTSISGTEITVSGEFEAPEPLELNIDPGVTVNWQVDFSVTIPGAYLINLSGGGTFKVSSCIINNTGTGGALNVIGSGTKIIVDGGGAILSGKGGNAILVSADSVSVEVNSGGIVRSLGDNSNAAIQIGSNIKGAIVNVNGGSIMSDGPGYAINDGAGTGEADNSSTITLNEGVISAGSACAIHSTSSESVVNIKGGVVSNAAGNNANPAIFMNAGSGDNVTISGTGIVESTSLNGYAIQTTGNVKIKDDAHVIVRNGRAINLIGLNSTATIEGGFVHGEGANVICTATTSTDTVANASIIVTGGVVSSTGGNAICITGNNSKVIVSGGSVESISGNAIYANSDNAAANSAAKFEIVVSGGSVRSDAGYAIRNNGGADSAVKVSDTVSGSGGSGGSGGQVSVMTEGPAIRSNGPVTINGGFVFALGTNPINAILAPFVDGPFFDRGLIGVWNQDAGITVYAQTSPPNILNLHTSASTANAMQWFFHPVLGNGISYTHGLTSGFFPLELVTVTRDYGLIFDSKEGKMYGNVDGTGRLSPANLATPIRSGPRWTGGPGKLQLNGFSWVTKAETALIIIGQETTLTLTGENKFESTSGIDSSSGVKSDNEYLTIDGNGTLTAKGGYGFDLGNENMSLLGGTVVAQGSLSAINSDGAGPEGVTHYSWAFSGNNDGSDATSGFGIDDPFIYYATDHYVRLQTMQVTSFTALQTGGVSGLADSTGITISFSQPVANLTANDIVILDGVGSVVKGKLSGSENNWTIALDRVVTEGMVNIQISHFDTFFIDPYTQDVMVYKAADEAHTPGETPPSPVTSVVLDANKSVLGVDAVLKAGQFNFAVYEEDKLVSTGRNDADGNIIFSAITYKQEGTHTYKVVETSADGNGWITDAREHTVTVTVTENNDVLSAKADYPSGTIPTYYNLYDVDSLNGSDGSGGSGGKYPTLFISEHYAYVQGYPDGSIRPGRSITRAEVATVFFRLLKAEDRKDNWTEQNSFSDVDAGSWYNNAVSVMAKMEIINGYPDGTFKPNGAITRAELTAMIARIAKQMHILPSNTLSFSDIAGHWAASDIMYVADIGWVNGYPEGTFRPNQQITRAEFMTIVNRILERAPETPDDLLTEEMLVWEDNANIDAWYYLAVQEATNSHVPEYKDKIVPGLRFNYEFWVEMMENPDWAEIEGG